MIPAPAAPSRRRLLRRLRPPLTAAAGVGADRYRKHFTAGAHLQILLWHVLSGSRSLRRTHARLAAAGWWRVGLARGVSRSQLARSSTSRDAACAERLLAELVTAARGRADATARHLARVQLVDSTFLPLSLKLSPWSRHKRHPAGVRVQLGLDLGPTLAAAVPGALAVTLADAHDTRIWERRDLAALRGWTVVFDLGYYGHPHLARLRGAGVSFVCPLHPQARVEVAAARPVPPPAPGTPGGDAVLADQVVTLGSDNHRGSHPVPGLRLVTGRNARGGVRRFVTDRFDLSAAEVLALYRLRWQIELFFRWLKHALAAATPLGRSRAAVWLTVLVCACAALLAGLLDPAGTRDVSRIARLAAWAEALGRAPVAAAGPGQPAPRPG